MKTKDPLRISAILGAVCIAVLCIILTLGLWPFHAPRNEVAWLNTSDGVALGKYGSFMSRDPLKGSFANGISVEMWVQPARSRGATFLSLYGADKNVLFTLRQSLTDLELEIERLREPRGASETHSYVENAFAFALRLKKPVFVTVVSDHLGTAVYIDGQLVKLLPEFPISRDLLAPWIIVGDSPRQTDSFQGAIRGLAIYEAKLGDEQILKHRRTWSNNGSPIIGQDERNIALYLFNEKTGDTVHNRVTGVTDLFIPATFTNVDKIVFEPFWSEFDSSSNYWRGNLKNVVGFVPVGFCFYPFLILQRSRRAALVTIFLGFLISVVIETLQAFLPTRDSGTTDLITNTLGTYLGIVFYRHTYRFLINRVFGLRWLPSRLPN